MKKVIRNLMFVLAAVICMTGCDNHKKPIKSSDTSTESNNINPQETNSNSDNPNING